MNRYVVALTGASGMIYARELLAYFGSRPDLELHAIISEAGAQVLSLELGRPRRWRRAPSGTGWTTSLRPWPAALFGPGPWW